ncbi:MAG TPA: AlpA family phage regulatory protein [Devosia sp.]
MRAPQPASLLDTPQALLTLTTVKQLTGFSKTTIYRRMEDEEHPFPRPKRLSKSCVRWPAGAVKQWLQEAIDGPPST